MNSVSHSRTKMKEWGGESWDGQGGEASTAQWVGGGAWVSEFGRVVSNPSMLCGLAHVT